MEDRLRVTVVATGLGLAHRAQARPTMSLVYGNGVNQATGTEPIDYGVLDVPAVIRTRRNTIEAMAASGVDKYDIPAFLRKQAD